MPIPMGSGAADQSNPKPKPPDKPPEPQGAQKPADTTRPPDKPPQPDGKGGKDSKDNQTPAGPPQGGKPADVPKQPSDAGASRPGDSAGKQSGDAGQRHTGDAPAKAADGTGTRTADGPHQAGGEHPGSRESHNFNEWKANFENHMQQLPDGQRPAQSADTKVDRNSERYNVKLDLNNGCRDKNGKLDLGKVKEQLESKFRTDWSARAQAHLKEVHPGPKVDDKGNPHGGHREIHLGQTQLNVRVEHAKSNVEMGQVNAALDQVCKEYHLMKGHLEGGPGRAPVDVPSPGPIPGQGTRPEHKSGPSQDHRAGQDHQQHHQQGPDVRPVIRAPGPPPPIPWPTPNLHRGR